MHRSMAVLALALVLVLTAGVPASAATWFQLRYWYTNATANFGGTPGSWNSPIGGFSIRRDFGGGMWAGSLNFDTGAVNNAAGFSPPGPGAYNRFWSVNLHRNFPLATGTASVYAGWGSLAVEAPNLDGGSYIRQSGPRVGADAKINFRGNWYVTGNFAYHFGGNQEQLNAFVGGIANFSATAVDYSGGLGYMFGNWAIEGGYRVINWNFTPNPAATCPTTPCQLRWPGWYVGLNYTAP